MKVGKYLARQRQIFEQADQKQFQMLLPFYRNGSVKVTFEKHDEEDSQNQISGETCTTIQTSHGTVSAKASTDEPFSVEFVSKELLKPVRGRCGCILSACGHTVLTGKIEHQARKHIIKECVKFDIDKKSTFDVNWSMKAQVLHHNYSVHFEAFTREKMATIDTFLFNDYMRIGFNACSAWKPRTVLDTQIMLETKMFGSIVTASGRYVGRSIDLTLIKRFANWATAAACIEARNFGHSPDYLGRVAGEFAIDPNTTLKMCFATDKVLDCSLRLQYKNCSEMEFTGSVPVMNMRECAFGASISFDLTKLNKQLL